MLAAIIRKLIGEDLSQNLSLGMESIMGVEKQVIS